MSQQGVALEDPPVAWIKTGIEFYDSRPNLSTVATPPISTSDWSLIPLSSDTVTIKVERERADGGVKGPSLWVYLVEGTTQTAVREVTWPFSAERLLENLHVGVYVARPTKLEGENDTEELSAQFTDFVLSTV